MRDYSKVSPQFWIDFAGATWPIVRSSRRLKFKYPAHAALRRHVFHRDGYRCCHCPAQAREAPTAYDGRSTLYTDTFVSSGYPDVLVLDHVVTLIAGGQSVIENLQTLCETCNRKKIREDRAAAQAYHARGGL